ncbi:MAG: undecaprenyl-diphosphate phosphatase [Spirochaetaceae bacterium]|nr:undecaprenyl-diphosphate phosphatase [Spirochaetaceae bacterium]
MGILHAALLGLLQALTEFLPVSSSGHLALARMLFGLEEPALLFDTFLHLGTLVSVIIVLRHDIWALLRRPLQKQTGLLAAATAVTTVFALALKKIRIGGGESFLDEAGQTPLFLGAAFLITAASLCVSEFIARKKVFARSSAEMNLVDALVIGMAQGAGVLPGISRSGSTLAGALGRGIERESAAKFSFLLSIPAILGALVLQLPDIPESMNENWPPVAAGTLCAAIGGFFSIRIMLKIVKTRPLYGFAVYTAALGILVIVLRATLIN